MTCTHVVHFFTSIKVLVLTMPGDSGHSGAGAAVVGEPAQPALPLHLGPPGPGLLPLLHPPQGGQERAGHPREVSLLATVTTM